MIYLSYLIDFTLKEIRCCLFPALLFIALACTKFWVPPGIYRYDLLLYLAIFIQLILIKTGYESWAEVRIIFIFHIIGIALEAFKINIGAWSYPEAGLWKIWGVPLYSGFMYSSVGSYIYHAWKVFSLNIEKWPSKIVSGVLCLCIYLNFFTHHYIMDLRYIIIAAILYSFRKTTVTFTVKNKPLRMYANLSFLLIGFFLWVAENIASFFHAFIYPHQQISWHLVHWGKITSWSLLVILSVALVYYAKEKTSSTTENHSSAEKNVISHHNHR